MNDKIDLSIPWNLTDGARLVLRINDRQLIGSDRHSVRIDLYPLHSPSHPERHIGYWDIPLSHTRRRKTDLALRGDKLIVSKFLKKHAIQPTWKGRVEPLGYCTAVISLWNHSEQPAQMIEIGRSRHLIPPDNRNGDLPLEHVLISITERCNLECPMCNRHNSDTLSDSDAIPEVIDPLIEAAPHFMYAGVQGLGEPLLDERIFKITSDLKRRMPSYGRVATTTNGTLLDKNVAARIIDSGLNSFIISIDGASKATYEKSRPGANFEQVIRNVENAVEYRAKSGRKNLWFTVNYVILEHNIQEIPHIVTLAASMGLDCVAFHHMKDFSSGEISVVHEDELNRLFGEAHEIGTRTGVVAMIPGIRRLKETKCLFLQTAYVWLSGEVVPCYRMEQGGGHPWPVRSFGNVRNKPLMDIWNSPEYREFRQRIREGNLPKECAGCNFCDGLII